MPTFKTTFDNIAYSSDPKQDDAELDAATLEVLNASLKQRSDWPANWVKVVDAHYACDDESEDAEKKWFTPITIELTAANEREAETQEARSDIFAIITDAVGKNSASGSILTPEEGWEVIETDEVAEPAPAIAGRRRQPH